MMFFDRRLFLVVSKAVVIVLTYIALKPDFYSTMKKYVCFISEIGRRGI